MGATTTADSAKGVTLSPTPSRLCRAQGAPGPVARAILPQGPHALSARSAPPMKRVGGGVPPPWGFLFWWGRLGRGGPGGETKA